MAVNMVLPFLLLPVAVVVTLRVVWIEVVVQLYYDAVVCLNEVIP